MVATTHEREETKVRRKSININKPQNSRHSIVVIATLLCLLFFGSSCKKSLQYSEYKSVPNEAWYRSDTISFTPFTPSDSLPHSVTVGVRLTNNYEYRNASFILEALLPDNTITFRDTVSISVFDCHDHRTGQGFAFISSQSTPMPLRLSPQKAYHFRIYHIMRANPITGITDVGVTIE